MQRFKAEEVQRFKVEEPKLLKFTKSRFINYPDTSSPVFSDRPPRSKIWPLSKLNFRDRGCAGPSPAMTLCLPRTHRSSFTRVREKRDLKRRARCRLYSRLKISLAAIFDVTWTTTSNCVQTRVYIAWAYCVQARIATFYGARWGTLRSFEFPSLPTMTVFIFARSPRGD